MSNGVKKRDLGITGLVVVLTQALSQFSSTDKLAKDIEDFKHEFKVSLLEREEYFVRKSDLQPLIIKLDQVSEKLSGLASKVNSLKRDLQDVSFLEELDPVCRGENGLRSAL